MILTQNMVSKIFISYYDDKNQIVRGNFYLIKEATSYIKFSTLNGSIITLPWSRIIKVKQNMKGGDKK